MSAEPKQAMFVERSARAQLRSAESQWRATCRRQHKRRVQAFRNELLAALVYGALGLFFAVVIGLAIRWPF